MCQTWENTHDPAFQLGRSFGNYSVICIENGHSKTFFLFLRWPTWLRSNSPRALCNCLFCMFRGQPTTIAYKQYHVNFESVLCTLSALCFWIVLSRKKEKNFVLSVTNDSQRLKCFVHSECDWQCMLAQHLSHTSTAAASS